jgi:hypothetical protein
MQAALMLLLTLQHAHHQLLKGVPILQRRLATAGKVAPKLLSKKNSLHRIGPMTHNSSLI